MPDTKEIVELERQIFDLTAKLNALRGSNPTTQVPNYPFRTQSGATTLLDLFAEQNRMLVIHNMGQACRYCTLWADGFNGILPHLESAMSVVLVSKDPPDVQRRFANARGWRFRCASHADSDYAAEQSVTPGTPGMPGAVVYVRDGDQILRKNSCAFGPGDLYCSLYALLGLAGIEGDSFTPQFRYWSRPETLDDGGANVVD